MKRFVALLAGAALIMSCILGGCGKRPAEQPTAPTESVTEGENTLSVYLANTDALYTDALSSFQAAEDVTLDVKTFHSCEAMFNAMQEAFLSGGGPDVVLYNSRQGEIDGYKLARSGLFLPLEPFMGQLDPAIYPAELMDAGVIGGKRYFVPFSYSLIHAYTREELMNARGYSSSDNIYEMILDESEALMDVLDNVPNTMSIFRSDPVNAFFEAAGVTLFDKTTGEVTVDKAELAEICRFVKTVYDNAEKTAALNGQFSNDFAGAAKHFSFFSEDDSFLNMARFYQSLFPAQAGSPMVAIPYHKLNNTEALCASIVCFGGIGAHTKVPEKAYGLLQYILDFDVAAGWKDNEETAMYYAPVSLTVYEKAVDKLSINTGNGRVTIAPLTEENADRLMKIPQKITEAVIPNATLGLTAQTVLEPYFMGADSFDNCYDAFLEELRNYLSE